MYLLFHRFHNSKTKSFIEWKQRLPKVGAFVFRGVDLNPEFRRNSDGSGRAENGGHV